jgi:hypothetical protein
MLRATAIWLIVGNLVIYTMVAWSLLTWHAPELKTTRAPISVTTAPLWRPQPQWI